MSGLSSLVSGYGSDSDDDQDQQVNIASSSSNPKQNQTIKPSTPSTSTSTSKSSLFNSLPPPSNSSSVSSDNSTGISSKLGLPPPSTSSSSSRLGLPPPNNPQSSSSSSSSNPTTKKRKDKGKLQIGIQSLSSLQKSTSDDEGEDEPKPTLSSNSNGSGKPSHSLFGILPAPKRPKIDKEDEALKNQGAVRIKEVNEIEDSNQDGEEVGDEPPKKKVKGNNDFRAMLGLKSNGKEKERKKVEKKQEVKNVEIVPSNGASSVQSQVSKKVESAPQRDEKPQENSDFFSLGPKPSSSTSSNQHLNSTPTFQISSAPIFEEESLPPVPTDPTDPINPYRGWNQDPDGSWVPITPEAWSAYNLYLSTQSQSTSTSTSSSISKKNPTTSETGGGGGFSSSELEKYGLKEEDLESVDAGEIAARAFALRGVNDLNPTPIGSSSNSGSGSGLTNGMNSKDKMKFNKARGKGQLSSLIAHANERRGDLEQKWSEGKDKQRQGGAKYGF